MFGLAAVLFFSAAGITLNHHVSAREPLALAMGRNRRKGLGISESKVDFGEIRQ